MLPVAQAAKNGLILKKKVEEHTSEAKANHLLSTPCDTTEVVP
jgi:hypothetical protein